MQMLILQKGKGLAQRKRQKSICACVAGSSVHSKILVPNMQWPRQGKKIGVLLHRMRKKKANVAEKAIAYLEYCEGIGVKSLPKVKSRANAEKKSAAKPETTTKSVAVSMENIPGAGNAALAALFYEIGDCQRCKLHRLGRSKIVFGVGNPKAKLMFIGEGPGEEEDKRGEPFVGRAGQLLNKIIDAMGLNRQEVYIANTVKCRPPDNRNPEPDEVSTCRPFWQKQIEIIQPQLIVTLGSVATKTVLETEEGISKLRGVFQDFRGTPVMPTYHPAFLLRSPGMKKFTWEDMKKVMERLDLKVKKEL